MPFQDIIFFQHFGSVFLSALSEITNGVPLLTLSISIVYWLFHFFISKKI